ncbi:MAG: 1-deoxy-D-xylulose-5-phosphate synthase [Oscillospiraceae bacterium]|nr:1-deoxy-D-xylulose-5-phosphate synthase [Oscillospiraceae bacterium]
MLEKIHSSDDIKQLNTEELPALCKEIRAFLIRTVSETGGHLASNLGTVELTVALHRVYDSKRDRIVFDVGHQSYTHKIITGRRDKLHTLRQFGGISGFPKPYEAEDDAFIAGHASNSVSVALGMAHARTLSGDDYDICAVIGDGAMTGGLSFEGLSNAAMSGEPLVVILNDNNMSIAENVGGAARLLQSMRVKPAYLKFKRHYRRIFSHLPALYTFNHHVKEWLKAHLIPDDMFSGMGFDYLGPIDGHDLKALENVIRWARDMRKPVLIHVLTKKGKGCPYAEANPELYHGVGPFDPETGVLVPEKEGFAARFGALLCRYAESDPKIAAITAAMSGGTGLEGFAARFPERFYDIGIAEEHAVSMAGGMAKQGQLPVFAVYSSFLQRAFDMLIHDISLQDLHAVFAVDRSGLVGRDGETHQGSFDVSFLSTVPGMTIYAPASFSELDAMLGLALYGCDGPVAIRYPRGGEDAYHDCHTEAEFVLREGSDLTIVSYGVMINEALEAADRLAEDGIMAEVIKIGRIRPNSFDETRLSVGKTKRLVVAEDVCAFGSVGSQILSSLAGVTEGFEYRLLNLGDGIVQHGSVEELRRMRGIDAQGIVRAARTLFSEE